MGIVMVVKMGGGITKPK